MGAFYIVTSLSAVSAVGAEAAKGVVNVLPRAAGRVRLDISTSTSAPFLTDVMELSCCS